MLIKLWFSSNSYYADINHDLLWLTTNQQIVEIYIKVIKVQSYVAQDK